MKVAIIGIRGIPNRYGGFEQFAELLAPVLVQRHFEVSVYCGQEYRENGPIWKGVNLIYQYCPHFLGNSFSQFFYDLACIIDSRKRDFDLIYHLGYTSSSIWFSLHRKGSCIVTNMDGMEWQRSKYGILTRFFLRYAEQKAVQKSHYLIADSLPVKAYLEAKYGKKTFYIPYSATCITEENCENSLPAPFIPDNYNLVICRIQEDNHTEMIIQGHLHSKTNDKLIIIGNYNHLYGRRLKRKYEGERVIFFGPLYDKYLLDQIRFHSKIYFHGHSAGGTNPSLLEAMAAKALITAHDNIFNRAVLGAHAFYFKNASDIEKLLQSNINKADYQSIINENYQTIAIHYQLDSIINKYLDLFNSKKS